MALISKRLVDKLIEAYVDWREASHLVSDAYRAWGGATGPDAAFAFECYCVALDREETAAEAYAELVRRLRRRVASPVTHLKPVSKARTR